MRERKPLGNTRTTSWDRQRCLHNQFYTNITEFKPSIQNLCRLTGQAWISTITSSSLPYEADGRSCVSDLEVVLYTRKGCHLCEIALDLLNKHQLSVQIVDIDDFPELKARYDTCVPVVVIDSKERFRGRVDEVLLRRFMRAKKV